jgi:hypothetical protein
MIERSKEMRKRTPHKVDNLYVKMNHILVHSWVANVVTDQRPIGDLPHYRMAVLGEEKW